MLKIGVMYNIEPFTPITRERIVACYKKPCQVDEAEYQKAVAATGKTSERKMSADEIRSVLVAMYLEHGKEH
jgi:phage gp16-like protein